MNHDLLPHVSRRQFLGAAAGSLLAPVVWAAPPRVEPGRPRPKVAALFTEFRFRSHAFNILENFFAPYLFNGRLVDPGVEVVSFYADQFPENDLARQVSRRLGVPLFPTIDAALCLGGRELAVDGVLSIAEHGDYPLNTRGQRMYPRKEFFDQAVAVMRRSGRFVPLFNDKHLSYRWDWAREMYLAARANGMPLLAGSSVPLAERRPPLELPENAEVEEAVAIHGGGLETYDFHGLEVLQSIVEARRGGETGIERIELLTGAALQEAQAAGRWSPELFNAAMAAERPLAGLRQPRPDREEPPDNPQQPPRISHAIFVTYRDGLRGTVLQVGDSTNRWNFACRLKSGSAARRAQTGKGEILSTAFFNGPWGNRCLFKALSHAIQEMFLRGREPYPAERTLLTTGALEAAMLSHEAGGRAIETPHLAIRYQPTDVRHLRENGASWKLITRDTPQSTNFTPGDAQYLAPERGAGGSAD